MVQQLLPVQQVLALPAVFSISPRHSYKKWAASCGLATILFPHNLSPKLVFMAHLVQLRGWCCHSASQYKIWGTLLWWYSPIHHHKQYYLDISCLETAQCWAHSSSTNTQHTPKFQPGEVLVSGGKKSAWPSFVIQHNKLGLLVIACRFQVYQIPYCTCTYVWTQYQVQEQAPFLEMKYLEDYPCYSYKDANLTYIHP